MPKKKVLYTRQYGAKAKAARELAQRWWARKSTPSP
jgi:hypothetical protein